MSKKRQSTAIKFASVSCLKMKRQMMKALMNEPIRLKSSNFFSR